MTLRFLQVTDHHLGRDRASVNRGYATGWALDRVLTAIGSACAHQADFILCTGDLVDTGEDEEYRFARSMYGVAPAGLPPGPLVTNRQGLERRAVYFVPGNHDPREAWLRNLFPAAVPRARLHLAWTVLGVEFVFIDLGTDGRAGTLDDEGLAFLDTALERERPTVLVLHHHPIAVGIPWLDRAVPHGIERLWQRLRGGRVLGVLFGHAHASVERRVHGVPVMGLRSTCFQFGAAEEPTFVIQPLQYRLVTIEEGALHSRVYEIPLTGTPEGRALT